MGPILIVCQDRKVLKRLQIDHDGAPEGRALVGSGHHAHRRRVTIHHGKCFLNAVSELLAASLQEEQRKDLCDGWEAMCKASEGGDR